MPGLLDNLTSNPWLAIGSGLLSAAGPSTDPRQIGLGPGLMAGLGNMNAMQQAQQQQQLQQLKAQQLKAQMAQAAQEQEQAKLDQERKARAIAALLENVPPEQRGLLGAVFNIDPGKAMSILEKMAIPEPPDLTTLQKEYQADVKSGAFTGTLLEYAAERERRKAAAVQPFALERAREGRSRVDVRVGGAEKQLGEKASEWVNPETGEPASPMMTMRDAYSLGYRPLTAKEKATTTEEAKLEARAEGGLKDFDPKFQEYQKAYREYQAQVGLGLTSGERDRANRARDALVAWVAKNLLGTPGAEPSPALYERAREIVPDFAGPVDSANFPQAMAQLRMLAMARRGAAAQAPGLLGAPPTASPLPLPSPPPGATLD